MLQVSAGPTQTLVFHVFPMTWPPKLHVGEPVLQACCINTPTSSAHLNAWPCRCGLPPAGLSSGPPLPCVPNATGWQQLWLSWTGPVLPRGLFCRPVGCHCPFFKECGPCVREAALFQSLRPRLLSLSLDTTSFSTVALYQSLITLYNKLSLFTSHMVSTSQLSPD